VEKRLQNSLFGCIRKVVSAIELRTQSDQELLQRFVSQRDDAAFSAVVRRHGPMVLRVAFRTLQNEHDAEDVFQATFLVLSQKAHTLRRQESLGSWLYGIAYRLALKCKATAGERRNREQRLPMTHVATPLAQVTVQEAQAIMDEEISRLPEKFRVPVVLCCLEGLTRDEAAQQIGCAASVLKGRLEHGRERLRQRLIARGLTLPCGLGAFLLLEGAAGATVPPALISSTTKAAITVAAGNAATTVVTAEVAALTEGVLRTMFLTKIKIAIVALVLGFMVMGATVFTYRTAAAQDDQPLIAVAQPAIEFKQEPKQEKEAFTAWGKEVGGLQMGVGYRPGEHRVYHHGETVTLVVRVRNVGKKEVKFQYFRQFSPNELLPTVTDNKGRQVPIEALVIDIRPAWLEVTLAPGKESDLYELKLDLRPASESANKTDLTLYGVGKFYFQHERMNGMFSPEQIKLDPNLDKLATGKLELEVKEPEKQPQKEEKGGFTAWGKEVNGLQAGLGFRPGEKRAYHHGETVKLVVRVRNVGKEAVKFQYLREFFIETPPTVTGGKGKPVPLGRTDVLGIIHLPVDVNLAPGKEIELTGSQPFYELELELKPASLYGTGKFELQYERVFGNSSAGGIKLDPTLGKLATGKLELEIKSDPPAAPKKQGTRQQAAANLSVLMGALHKYHDDPRQGRLPPAVIMGKDGKGGVPHSWRVEILPYLGEKALYDAYRFDEPWDSKHNKTLIARMPAVFRSPRDKAASTYASYFALVTPGLQPGAPGGTEAGDGLGGIPAPPNYDHGTIFSNPAGTRLTEIPDGTSNTVALVEAKREIHWTQPEDIRYFADKPLPKLGEWFPEGWHAGFADKEVKMLSPDNDETTIRRLFTIGDGHPTKPKFVP
jgi:RNA polymerase sigma factor (sigma-70 family)